MSSIDRSHGASAGYGDLMICAEFSYDPDDGSLAWSAVSPVEPGAQIEPGDLLELDATPVRQAIDLSLREGTPFSLGHSVVGADGVAHELVVCGLPDRHEGHPTVRGVVLELPADAEAPKVRELPRLTNHLGRLPTGVSADDLPWAGVDTLPADLLAMVNLCLDSGAPSSLLWGEQRRFIYNQAMADLIAEDHPRVFGASPAVVWPQGWSPSRDAVERVFATGEPASVADQLVPLTGRDGTLYRYFSFTLTPIRQEDGTVAGVYSTGSETTLAVQRRRRLSTLHDLAAQGVLDGSISELFTRIAATFAENPADIPFALMYLIEPGERSAVLQGATGLEQPGQAAPERIPLEEADGWPVAEAFEQGGTVTVDGVQDRFPGLRTASGETPGRAVLAFADRRHDRLPSSLNILGVSTRQSLDVEYQQFLHKVARHVQADLTAVATTQLDRERSANLQRAMQSNRQIGAAIGILMTIHKVTEQQAFQLLSRASQQSNRKLRDIADEVILSGALPAETLQPNPGRQATARRGRNTRSTR